jgi:hypothetical protein
VVEWPWLLSVTAGELTEERVLEEGIAGLGVKSACCFCLAHPGRSRWRSLGLRLSYSTRLVNLSEDNVFGPRRGRFEFGDLGFPGIPLKG